jgi:hypothetical protein
MDHDENNLTMHTLKMQLRGDLEADKADILGANYPDDELNEYVDSRIPVYHGRLVELLYSDVKLGYGPDDSGLLGEAPTVWDILTAAVYERLSAEAAEWLEEARAEQELEAEIVAAVASMEPLPCA